MVRYRLQVLYRGMCFYDAYGNTFIIHPLAEFLKWPYISNANMQCFQQNYYYLKSKFIIIHLRLLLVSVSLLLCELGWPLLVSN